MHKLEATDTLWTSHIYLWPPKIHGGPKEEQASSATEVRTGDTRWEPVEPAVQGLPEPGRWGGTWGVVRVARHHVFPSETLRASSWQLLHVHLPSLSQVSPATNPDEESDRKGNLGSVASAELNSHST